MFAIRKSGLAAGCLTFCLAVIPAAGAHAATWTFTPELKRLDAEGNELSAGAVGVARHERLMVGVYVRVTTDGAASPDDAHLGFESFSGAIHFVSDELKASDIGPGSSIAAWRAGLATAHGQRFLRSGCRRLAGSSRRE